MQKVLLQDYCKQIDFFCKNMHQTPGLLVFAGDGAFLREDGLKLILRHVESQHPSYPVLRVDLAVGNWQEKLRDAFQRGLFTESKLTIFLGVKNCTPKASFLKELSFVQKQKTPHPCTRISRTGTKSLHYRGATLV